MSTGIISLMRGGVARAFAGTMMAAIPARFAQLAMTLLLAPRLGPEGFGLFVFAQGFSQLSARLGALGWPTLLLRMIPVYQSNQDWARLKGLQIASNWVGLLSAICVIATTLIISSTIPMDQALSWGLILGAVILIPMILRTITRNALAGYKHPAKGIVLDELLPPLLTILTVLTLGISDASQTILAYGVVSAIAVGFGVFHLHRIAPVALTAVQPRYEISAWMKIALPALVGMSAQLIMNRSDVVMLAPLSSLQEVSNYALAQRISFLQSFPVVVMSSVLGPRLSAAVAANSHHHARQLYYGGLGFSLACTSIIGLALIYWRTPIMVLLFSEAYAASANVLVVLALSQIAACMCIPAASFLVMSGRERVFGAVTFGALCLNLCLNAALIPSLGAVGAALATLGAGATLATVQILLGLRVLRQWKAIRPSAHDARQPNGR